MYSIDAATFKAMIRSGAMDLRRHSDEVNSLNVFPVPDGDTGVNMLATIGGGVDALSRVNEDSLGACCKALSRGMLLAARGNSGVILSQFFAGLGESLAKYEQANVLQFSQAFEAGVKRAYEVVVKPVEGTILTVMRQGSQMTMEHMSSGSSFEEYFKELVANMKVVLNSTPDLLPVLKEAGVIDSGGAGLLYIVEGMGQALGGKLIEEVSLNLGPSRHADSFAYADAAFDENSTLDYGYCTEFILQLTKDKKGVDAFSLPKAIDYLSSIGDSLVAFQDGTVVKVHVHTKTPDKAISYALQFGEFIRFKMENMTLQYNQTLVEKSRSIASMVIPESPKRALGAVAVSPTKEISQIFKDSGVTEVVECGPLMNPGTQDFIDAIKKCNADRVLVFPNNKNEVMVAELAGKEFPEGSVVVLPIPDLVHGISGASVLDTADMTLEENVSRINANIAQSDMVSIFQSAQDCKYFGHDVKKGDYLWNSDERHGNGKTLLDSFLLWLDSYQGSDASLFTVIYNAKIPLEVRKRIESMVEKRFDFVEIQPFDGGETLYDLYAILD